ncbi:hypothetical protein [Planomonospora sp. ID82291]|uniref:hypothetical protein n=1 Tax=Planomonospora sp. ID82291 TaxID=2738136 RepID=UPI0018C3B955|nr:hypothetical protein [Planomonospora sp. ID82291]MBG0818453.1 hypothetical protein [Planomonospora sp. ID82291]
MTTASARAPHRGAQQRRRRYADLRLGGMDPVQAAAEVGVTPATGKQYERALAARQASGNDEDPLAPPERIQPLTLVHYSGRRAIYIERAGNGQPREVVVERHPQGITGRIVRPGTDPVHFTWQQNRQPWPPPPKGLARPVNAALANPDAANTHAAPARQAYQKRRTLDRDRLAGDLIELACDLACIVRDEGADAAQRFLQKIPDGHRALLPIMLAAMIPDDRPVTDLLAWAVEGWQEGAEALPPPMLPFATVRYRRDGTQRRTRAEVKPCGTVAAYARHLAHKEPPCQLCKDAERAYRKALARSKACSNCDQPSTRIRRSYCPDCYARWKRHGYPADGPPPVDEIPPVCLSGQHSLDDADNVIVRSDGTWRCRACQRLWLSRTRFEKHHAGHDLVDAPDGKLACLTCRPASAPPLIPVPPPVVRRPVPVTARGRAARHRRDALTSLRSQARITAHRERTSA